MLATLTVDAVCCPRCDAVFFYVARTKPWHSDPWFVCPECKRRFDVTEDPQTLRQDLELWSK